MRHPGEGRDQICHAEALSRNLGPGLRRGDNLLVTMSASELRPDAVPPAAFAETGTLPAGMYMVRLQHGNETAVRRVAIAR